MRSYCDKEVYVCYAALMLFKTELDLLRECGNVCVLKNIFLKEMY